MSNNLFIHSSKKVLETLANCPPDSLDMLQGFRENSDELENLLESNPELADLHRIAHQGIGKLNMDCLIVLDSHKLSSEEGYSENQETISEILDVHPGTKYLDSKTKNKIEAVSWTLQKDLNS